MSFHFDQLFRKKLEEVPHFVKKHEKPWIWQKLASFRANYDVLAFSWSFQKEVAESASFREKAREIIDLANTMQLFQQTTMFLRFDELYGKKLQKLPHFVKKHEKSWIWPKLCNFFEQTIMFLSFDKLFSKRLQKVAQCEKKHQKSSIWPKLCNFSRKLPCLCISINFSGESCKKCLISWNSTKNHPFAQIFATFRTNFHVFAFRWIFKEKVAKSASFREKAPKIIDFANTLQLFEQNTMFWHFDEVFSKKLQKVPHFVKKHEKSSIWRKLATFPTNYHVLTLWWTFQRKVAESASFSEKTLQIIDWAKTCNFFEQSTMFMRFDQLFSKRLQKVPRSVKKHEKSSIWQKLATFRTNYHVLAFRWTFQEKKNAKSRPFREKARTLIDLAKTCNFSKKLPCFGISMIIAGKSCKKVEKVAHFVKNDEKSSIWPKLATFRGNYHVSAFLSTFQQKVSHFVKKHEKSSFGSCLAHS